MYLSEVYGEGGIYAKVVAASSANGINLWTLETCSPKFIDAEMRTHRMLSQNSSSSRAIPFKALDDVYLPFDIRKNEKGMQGYEKVSNTMRQSLRMNAKLIYENTLQTLEGWGGVIHKQHLNRYLEPWTMQKKVITGTEWSNFFKLRLADDAQPEIQELARCMEEAINKVKDIRYIESGRGEWHLPYVKDQEISTLTTETALKCSAARCARVSYKNHDKTNVNAGKDLELYNFLIESGHLTPLEHQATPMHTTKSPKFVEGFNWWEDGISHVDRNSSLWSGTFRGWIQNRKLVE